MATAAAAASPLTTGPRNPGECIYPVKLKPGLRPGTGVDMAKRIGGCWRRAAPRGSLS